MMECQYCLQDVDDIDQHINCQRAYMEGMNDGLRRPSDIDSAGRAGAGQVDAPIPTLDAAETLDGKGV